MGEVRTGAAVIDAAGLLATGCPNANTYGTARTTPAGKVNHSISAEGFGARIETPTTDNNGTAQTEKTNVFLPLPPSYHLRLGASDNIDVGFHVYNMSSLGFDAKLNIVKGRVDLGIDPGVQWYQYSIGVNDTKTKVNVVYLHGPLLIDFNVNKSLSFVLSPGVEYSYVSADVSGGSGNEAARSADGVFARIGLGINIRASKKFAVHPEVTVFRNFRDEASLLYMAGIGFNFGNLPSFDDVE